jgi:hypothetical protein
VLVEKWSRGAESSSKQSCALAMTACTRSCWHNNIDCNKAASVNTVACQARQRQSEQWPADSLHFHLFHKVALIIRRQRRRTRIISVGVLRRRGIGEAVDVREAIRSSARKEDDAFQPLIEEEVIEAPPTRHPSAFMPMHMFNQYALVHSDAHTHTHTHTLSLSLSLSLSLWLKLLL